MQQPAEKSSRGVELSTDDWRRRRDSNPRYGNSPYGGLANRWFQPLTHVSECGSGAAGYIVGVLGLQPERRLFRDHVETHVEAQFLARFQNPHPELRPF